MNTKPIIDFLAGGWKKELGTEGGFKRHQEIREKEMLAAEIELDNDEPSKEDDFRITEEDLVK